MAEQKWTMRGEYMDPVINKAHHSAYSTYIDRDRHTLSLGAGTTHPPR